jgi:diguanylate cyclase (GGDEF)-like protein
MRETEETAKMDHPGEFSLHRDFLLHFIPLVVISVVTVIVGLEAQKYLRTERIKIRAVNVVAQQQRVIQTDLAAHASDALLVGDIIRSGQVVASDRHSRQRLFERFLVSLSRVKQVYDQVRFLDVTGREVVRINVEQGRPYAVEQQYLQNKGTRPYFIKALQAASGDVIISRFDLNMEHGRVERPLKPVLRFSTPVDDHDGHRLGVVVLNYCGEKLIETIKRVGESGDGDSYLINSNGFWLIGPTPEEEWGFMPGREHSGHIRERFPELWELIRQQDQGQVVLGDNLFTFTNMTPTRHFQGQNSAVYPHLKETESWVLISRVPMDVMSIEYFLIGVPLGVLTFIGLGIVAWLWSSARYREHLATARLMVMATRDGLTNLYNRTHFVHCADREIQRAIRYKRPLALLLFDIDHFKKINDTYGHDRGDEVLRELGRHLLAICREQDVPGRVGGEEFAVLLPETDHERAAAVAERLRQAVEKIEVSVDEKTMIRFTISVGVVSLDRELPDRDFQTLFNLADSRMYQAKKGGRNRVVAG